MGWLWLTWGQSGMCTCAASAWAACRSSALARRTHRCRSGAPAHAAAPTRLSSPPLLLRAPHRPCCAPLLQERALLKKLRGTGDGAVDIFFRQASTLFDGNPFVLT